MMRWMLLMLSVAAVVAGSVPEPDHIIYGTPTIDGEPVTTGVVTVTVGADPTPVASYVLGSVAGYGTWFVLEVPVSASSPVPPGVSDPGASVQVFVNGELLSDTLLGGPGTMQNLDQVVAGMPPEISITPASVLEGDAGPMAAVFHLSLSKEHTSPVSVDYATAPETAAAGTDFESVSGTLVFDPGEVSAPVDVDVLGDVLDEQDETFTLSLDSPSNATIAEGAESAQGLIIDDDPMPAVVSEDEEALEPCFEDEIVEIGVWLDAPSGLPVEVSFTTSAGTAQTGVDFEPSFGRLVFQPGETSKTIPLTVLMDDEVEPAESFFLEITSASNGVVTVPEVMIEIIDKDSGYPCDMDLDCRFTAADIFALGKLLSGAAGPGEVPGDGDCDRSGGAPDLVDLVCLLERIFEP